MEVNLLTGAGNYDRTDAGTIHSNGGGPKADWKVAPLDLIAGAECLRIAESGDKDADVWYYHVPASLNSSNPAHPPRLESGKQLTLNLTLKKTPDTGNTVTLTNSAISGWDTQPPINGNIDINGNGGPTSGDIDMTNMNADVAQLTILAAIAAGHTEIKLTGEFSKKSAVGTFSYNTQITKCDLTGVTGWGRTPTLPELAFMNCTALQEVTLPDDVRVIGSSAFFGCAALTTVNLSQVTWINLNAFWGCTSLETLALDNVTAIGQEAFYGCTGLETLKIPKCTRFVSYIVTGCKALTRIEATAAGDFVSISDGTTSIEHTAVFHNRDGHTGDNAFDPAKCDLVLNADKQYGGTAVPTATAYNEWTVGENGSPMKWKSVSITPP